MSLEIDQLLAAKEKEILTRSRGIRPRDQGDVEPGTCRQTRSDPTLRCMLPSSWDATARAASRAVLRSPKVIAAASRRCRGSCRLALISGILYLTIFSFSSENWSRPASEIGDLFRAVCAASFRNDLATAASRTGEGACHRERADSSPNLRPAQ